MTRIPQNRLFIGIFDQCPLRRPHPSRILTLRPAGISFIVKEKGDHVMPLQENLAANIKRIRQFHQLSLAELAESAGVGKSSLQAIEAGNANSRLDTVETIEQNLSLEEGSTLASPPDTDLPALDAPKLLLSSVPALRRLPPE
ncbi:MAG: helix-turn-helix transcriptional regulator [Clostridia bacterium]|nr:helix-turn-helix transcriptional regulator [Clostridia bacterium]